MRLSPGSQAEGSAVSWGSWLTVTVLGLIFAARLASVAVDAPDQVAFTVALFVVPFLYAVPRTRPLVRRNRWLALAVQAALTWVPLVLFASHWQFGIGGLLAGLVLLVVPGWASWLLAGGLLAADVIVRATVTGLPVQPAWYGIVTVIAYNLNDALVFFGLVRLTQIAREVADARDEAAGLAVAQERLEAARSLQAAVGERLTGIAAKAMTARQLLRSDPPQAGEQIAAVGAAARDAAAEVRKVAGRRPEGSSQAPAGIRAGRAVIGAGLAWTVLATVVSVFAVDAICSFAYNHYDTRQMAMAVVAVVLATTLQLYHSRTAAEGRKPWAWPVTLGLQAVLAYIFVFPFAREYNGFLGPLLAGSVLLLLPARWRWGGFAAVVASYPVLYAVMLPPIDSAGGPLIPDALYVGAVTAEIGLLAYGLAWLAGLAAQMEQMQGEMARAAVIQERLRIARDVHDLLGLGLSAIALKADLIGRLVGRDNARADSEVAELSRICASARADIRLVAEDSQRLSVADEITASRQILASAGIEVHVTLTDGGMLASADEVLAPVLREATTNILRHAAATTCVIKTTASEDTLRLQVFNDGVTGSVPSAQTTASDCVGRGLANLKARVQGAGGYFTSGQKDGQFSLMAEVPARGFTSAS